MESFVRSETNMDCLAGNQNFTENDVLCIITKSRNAKKIKLALEEAGFYNKKRKILKLENDEIAIPINNVNNSLKSLQSLLGETSARMMQFDHSRFPDEKLSPRKLMLSKLKALLVVAGVDWSKELEKDIPYRWEQHGDLIIIPENCFISDVWLSALGSGFWVSVASALGTKRLAKASCVENNNFRSPRVTLLVGTNSWVSHIDNGITYMFDVTKCMFSSGNITEKMRVAKMDCFGQVIVDLFAGIGYFVLPFLVHANAAFVHACEWNPHAVEALRRNLVQNKVNEKCEVHFGDNRKFPYKGIADHVNLGLIPSSEFAWPVACRSLRSDVGGWLHIHGNISSADSKNSHLDGLPFPPTCNKRIRKAWLDWSNTVASKIKILLQHEHLAIFNWTVDAQHIEHVKSYAPHIDHLVLDLECRPVCTN